MSDRASDREQARNNDREDTRAPGASQQPAEEYTDYRQVDPDAAGEEKAEAVDEAARQPGTPASKRQDAARQDAARQGGNQPSRRSSS